MERIFVRIAAYPVLKVTVLENNVNPCKPYFSLCTFKTHSRFHQKQECNCHPFHVKDFLAATLWDHKMTGVCISNMLTFF